jgi:hypothetical protein
MEADHSRIRLRNHRGLGPSGIYGQAGFGGVWRGFVADRLLVY